MNEKHLGKFVSRRFFSGSSKGLVTLVLLWAILLLVLFVLGLAFRSTLEMRMVGMSQERTRAYLIGWAGIQEVMEILRNDDPAIDSLVDDWVVKAISGELKGGRYRVEVIYDEERFVDLNFTDVDLLRRVFGDDPVLVPSILDWLDRDELPRPGGAETDDYYKKFGYRARNSPMKNAYEVHWVRGGEKFKGSSVVPDGPGISSLFDKSKLSIKKEEVDCSEHNPGDPVDPGDGDDGFIPDPREREPTLPPPPPPPPLPPGAPSYCEYTVYGDGLNNLNTATLHVLIALGFRCSVAEKIMLYRGAGNVFTQIDRDYIINELISKGFLAPDDEEGKASIRWVVNSRRLKVNSSYFRVRIRAEAGKGAKYQAVAVIERLKKERPDQKCRIVAWWEMGWW